MQKITTLLVTAIAAMVLSACGSSAGSSSSAVAPSGAASTATADSHNAADVSFATDMIPHHGQAVEMADMALSAASNPEVKKLAQTIKSAQEPEILSMTGWLKAWKSPIPSSSMGAMTGMSQAPGMMSDDDMTRLGKATGATFDRMWVAMMITHHQGAVTMSKSELTNGHYPGAKSLARSIIASQTAEIAQLQTLEKKLPA